MVWNIVKLSLILLIGTAAFRYIERDNSSFDDIRNDAEVSVRARARVCVCVCACARAGGWDSV